MLSCRSTDIPTLPSFQRGKRESFSRAKNNQTAVVYHYDNDFNTSAARLLSKFCFNCTKVCTRSFRRIRTGLYIHAHLNQWINGVSGGNPHTSQIYRNAGLGMVNVGISDHNHQSTPLPYVAPQVAQEIR